MDDIRRLEARTQDAVSEISSCEPFNFFFTLN